MQLGECNAPHKCCLLNLNCTILFFFPKCLWTSLLLGKWLGRKVPGLSIQYLLGEIICLQNYQQRIFLLLTHLQFTEWRCVFMMNLPINNVDPQLCMPIKDTSLERSMWIFTWLWNSFIASIYILKGLLHSPFNESICFCGNRCELKWHTDLCWW